MELLPLHGGWPAKQPVGGGAISAVVAGLGLRRLIGACDVMSSPWTCAHTSDKPGRTKCGVPELCSGERSSLRLSFHRSSNRRAIKHVCRPCPNLARSFRRAVPAHARELRVYFPPMSLTQQTASKTTEADLDRRPARFNVNAKIRTRSDLPMPPTAQ